ncbi:MAG: ribonuclease H family protein [Bacteroidales bacterium]|nr:ribonuclease H family protein [Bacteroidales bacterium]
MAKKGSKFYVVWIGLNPGIYRSWDECQAQISGFEGARFKSFATEIEAVEAFRGNMWSYLGKNLGGPTMSFDEIEKSREGIIWESISVDAACSGNPGVMEYQGVYTKNGKRIFHGGPFEEGTNNIGEFLALVHALALLKEKGKVIPVYTDSETARAWVKNKHAKTKLEQTSGNAKLFELIQRAEKWLKTNLWETPVLKWNTEKWGEIPADFGRK